MLLTKYEELKFKFSREELLSLLCNKKYTYRDLQKEYGYNERLFSKLAKEYKIPIQYDVIAEKSNEWHKINFNLNHVLHLYFELNKSLREIAKIYNTRHNSVSKFLKNNNIEIRSGYSSIYYESRRKKYSRYKNIDSSGYIVLSVNGERIREHRYIMEQHIGRKLNEDEDVHHIDFIKTNNDISNLFLFKDFLHQLYHGYIETHSYISPNEYLNYYEINLKNTYENPEWLYIQYINNERSCNDISKELDISRTTVVNKLKEIGIYDLRSPTINQYL